MSNQLLDEKDRLVDFTIDGVTFDHKTSIFPKNFPYPIDEAIKKTDELNSLALQTSIAAAEKAFKEQTFHRSLLF